jgi:hypothetical protein
LNYIGNLVYISLPISCDANAVFDSEIYIIKMIIPFNIIVKQINHNEMIQYLEIDNYFVKDTELPRKLFKGFDYRLENMSPNLKIV